MVVVLTMVTGCISADSPDQPGSDRPRSEPPVSVEAGPPSEGSDTTEGSAKPEPELEAQELAEFEPATRGEGSCEVRVVELLEASKYRGPGPITPALDAQLRADPQFADLYNARSHGDSHIQCLYEVQLGGQPGVRYRWREVYGNTGNRYTLAICNGPVGPIADHIISSTLECTDLDAKAYWGDELERLP